MELGVILGLISIGANLLILVLIASLWRYFTEKTASDWKRLEYLMRDLISGRKRWKNKQNNTRRLK